MLRRQLAEVLPPSPLLLHVPSCTPGGAWHSPHSKAHFLSSVSEEILLQMCSPQRVCLESSDMLQGRGDSQQPLLLTQHKRPRLPEWRPSPDVVSMVCGSGQETGERTGTWTQTSALRGPFPSRGAGRPLGISSSFHATGCPTWAQMPRPGSPADSNRQTEAGAAALTAGGRAPPLSSPWLTLVLSPGVL